MSTTMPPPPIVQWGLPTASKRALCLHAMTGIAQYWHYIADALVDQGFNRLSA